MKKYKPNEEEKLFIKHALGLDRSDKEYRNYYATSERHSDNKHLENLVKQRLMVKRKDPFNDFGGILYHVTELGRRVIVED